MLCRHGTAVLKLGEASSTPAEVGATASGTSEDLEIDKPVFMKESVKLGPFQTQIIKYKTNPLLGKCSCDGNALESW